MNQTSIFKNAKIFLRTFLFCFCFYVSAKAQTPSTASQVLTPDGVFDNIFDKDGNKYMLEKLLIQDPQGNTRASTTCTPGYFRAFFDPGSGMEGSSTSETDRRNVICQVLTDISAFLPAPAGSPLASGTLKINIWVRDISQIVANPGTTGVLGLATSFYVIPSGAPTFGGIADNEIYKTLTSGFDSYTNVASPLISTNQGGNGSGAYYHGMMAFNFSNPSINWETNMTNTSTSLYDLYTVALHEITHALGIASLIDFNGASKFGSNLSYYGRFDMFLRNVAGTTNLIVPNSSSCSLYNFKYNAALNTSILSPGCTGTNPSSGSLNQTVCADALKYVGGVTLPLYTPTCFERPSSLSHFEDQCYPTGTPYGNDLYFTMSNAQGIGTLKRYLKPEERTVLCDLGYRVNSTYGSAAVFNSFFNYGTGQCPGTNVAGINDGINTGGAYTFIGFNSTAIPINTVLTNDVGAVSFECMQVVIGAGILSTTSGTTLTYTPSVTGVHLLRYIPVASNGKRGNITYVFVYSRSTNCTPSACDAVNNGGFENSTNCGSLFDFPGNYGTNPIPTLDCWSPLSGTPDLYARGCFTGYGFGGGGVPTTVCNPAADTWNNGANNNNKILGVGSSNNWLPTNTLNEALQNSLSSPLTPNTSYILTFKARVANALYNNLPGVLVFAGSPNLLAPISFFYISLPAGLTPLAQVTVPNNNQWNPYSVSISSTSASNLNFLTLLNAGYLNGNPAITANYILIDDISIIPASQAPTFIPPSTVCLNQILTLDDYVNPPGGTFSGPGVTCSGGTCTFNASSAGAGSHIISYTYTNNLGCTNSVAATISVVNQNINVTVSASPPDICPGQQSVLTAAGAVTYNWTPGALTGNPVTVAPTVTTLYTVTGTSSLGCRATASVTVSINCCTVTPGILAKNIAPGALSSSIGTSLTGFQVSINGTFTIDNNFTFSGCNVLLGTNAKIVINPTRTLNITSSNLSACVNLWDGIYINGTTAKLNVTSSTIKDAEHAVVSVNGGPYTISSSILDKNHIGIDVQSYNGAHTGTITSTQFTSSATLKNPRPGERGYAGVLLTNVTGSINITGSGNIFDNLDYGVYGTNSNATIQKALFRNLTGLLQSTNCNCSVPPPPGGCPPCPIPTPVGVGVFVTTPSPNNPYSILVGGTTAALANTFQQCFQAVNVFNYKTVTVQRNTMSNSSLGSVSRPIGNTGITVRHASALYSFTANIRNNTITNYRSGVIYTLDDQTVVNYSTLNINNNTVSAPLFSLHNPITVQSVLPTVAILLEITPWLVQSNTANQAGRGIQILNMSTPHIQVLTNTISIPNTSTRYGILVQNSSNILVQTNTINGSGNTNLNIRGISVELSRIKVNDNTINSCGVGIQCLGVSNPTQLSCNKMNSCQRGVFLNNSDIGNQPTVAGTGFPSDNQWAGSTAKDIYGVNPVLSTWDIRGPSSVTQYNPSLQNASDIFKNFLSSTAPSNCSPPPCNPACQQNLMAQITGNQIPFQSFIPQSRTLSKQSVFNDLESDVTLMNQGTPEDAVLQNFHDSVKFTCIGKFRKVNDLISAGNITQATTENNSTIPACTIEQNHKSFNQIYLVTLGAGLNVQQKLDLASIAQQCPLTGGTSVYQARVLLSIINDSTIEYNDDCTDGGNRSMIFEDNSPSVQQAINNSAFKLYPNPNNGTMQLDYTLEKEQRGVFVIYDLLGKKQAEYELQQNASSVSISEAMLNNGIYFYKILINDKLVATDKLVIVK
ncbi:MAG: T9SS type A sorting domain-containing protein [Bacteroidota bacterium]